jgi:endonuclease YncB( thermonuclease family)
VVDQPYCRPHEESGRVVNFSDGDTLTILDADKRQLSIRTSVIDAPEKAKSFGNRSRQNLHGMICYQMRVLVQV